MKIIPAIDIIEGKCVRLSKGDYSTKKIYRENPVDTAKEFENAGVRFLHLVDLDGARSKHIVNQKVLENIAKETSLHIDFGGGIKTQKDIETAFDSGAQQVTLGSIAVQSPDFSIEMIRKYGSEKIILGADCYQRKIKISGWQEESREDIIDFLLRYQEQGIRQVICTDIAKDGMLEGPSVKLYKEILDKTSVHLTASGGISSIADLYAVKELGCKGAIIGKALYEGKITLTELQKLIGNA